MHQLGFLASIAGLLEYEGPEKLAADCARVYHDLYQELRDMLLVRPLDSLQCATCGSLRRKEHLVTKSRKWPWA